MPLFTNYGKPKGLIVNYMKDIEQKYIPALNQQLNTNINNYPSLTRETYAVYEDDEQGVGIELSSNHVDIENRGDLFVAVSYDGMKEDAGIINLNNVQDAVDITQYSLQELGFKTPDDIIQDEIDAETREMGDKVKKSLEDEERAKKKEELLRQAEENNKNVENGPVEDTEPENDNYDEEKENYQADLSRRLSFLTGEDEGARLELEWLVLPEQSDTTTMQFVHIEMIFTHVSGENFLIETKKVNPKIQTICNIPDCIKYADKVSDKTRVIPTMVMKDERGRDLDLPDSFKGNKSDEDEEEDEYSINI